MNRRAIFQRSRGPSFWKTIRLPATHACLRRHFRVRRSAAHVRSRAWRARRFSGLRRRPDNCGDSCSRANPFQVRDSSMSWAMPWAVRTHMYGPAEIMTSIFTSELREDIFFSFVTARHRRLLSMQRWGVFPFAAQRRERRPRKIRGSAGRGSLILNHLPRADAASGTTSQNHFLESQRLLAHGRSISGVRACTS